MTDLAIEHKSRPDQSAASEATLPLTNVGIALTMMEEAVNPDAEAGLRLFYGNSGWGKTFAVTACAIEYDAAYVCAVPGMTAKSWLLELIECLGEGKRKGNVVALTKYATDTLLDTGQSVIVDEADQLVNKAILNTLRAVHDRSRAAFILVGEEKLAERLAPFEQLDNRIIGWHPAEPCTVADAKKLAGYFARDLDLATDLLEAVVSETEGCTRRVRANFIQMKKIAHGLGEEAIDLTWWQTNGKGFITGAKPLRPGEKPRTRRAR